MKLLNTKLLIIIASTALALTACNEAKQQQNDDLSTDIVKNTSSAKPSTNKEALPLIEFEKEIHDFGRIREGEKVAYSFKFKNTGKSDLIITDARGSCGCTVPNYPTNPIKPGESALIDISFDSSGKSGKQNKTITVLTNCEPSTKVLTIVGEVLPIEKK